MSIVSKPQNVHLTHVNARISRKAVSKKQMDWKPEENRQCAISHRPFCAKQRTYGFRRFRPTTASKTIYILFPIAEFSLLNFVFGFGESGRKTTIPDVAFIFENPKPVALDMRMSCNETPPFFVSVASCHLFVSSRSLHEVCPP